MKKPLVSVLMLTYNHEKFVSQALESVLEQKTSFSYEVVIGDDVSADSTRAILLNYKRKYPTLIRLIFNKVNLKPTANFMNVYNNCRGKYIALLEGDDYWTSPLKLQTQVDFMESNPSFAICYHYASMVNLEGKELLLLPIEKHRKLVADLQYLIENDSFMATCSTFFRNNLFGKFPKWFDELTYIADFPLNVLNAQYGKIGLLNESMSVYRAQSSKESFSSQSIVLVHLEKLKVFSKINKHLGYAYDKIVKKRISGYYFTLAKAYLEMMDFSNAIYYYKLYKAEKVNTHFISIYDKLTFPIKLKFSQLNKNNK